MGFTRRKRLTRQTLAGLVLAPALVLACGGGDDAAPRAADPPRPSSDLHGYDTVFVYVDGPLRDEGMPGPLVALPRPVPDSADALSYAVRELLAGPTEAEEASGVSTWFSERTAGMLRGVTLEDGFAVVDFEDLRPVIPNASSSAGSLMLMRHLQATVFQLPEVRRVEFRIEGDCEAFMAWLQTGCVPLRRSSFDAPDGFRTAVRARRRPGG